MLCISGTALDESNFLYIHSHTNVYLHGLVPPNPGQSDMSYVALVIGAQQRDASAGGVRMHATVTRILRRQRR